jgi:hypothetical protein
MPTAMDKRFKSVASSLSLGILPAESRSAHRKKQVNTGAQGRIRTSVAPESGRFTVCCH